VVLRSPLSARKTADLLRGAAVPVLARVRDDVVSIDVRTLLEDDEAAVEAAVAGALGAGVR